MNLHEIYKAKVVEVLEDGSIILSFQGSLIRVVNQSSKRYKNEELVRVQVTKIRPLEFKLLQQNPSVF